MNKSLQLQHFFLLVLVIGIFLLIANANKKK